jgi:hypothetical protein
VRSFARYSFEARRIHLALEPAERFVAHTLPDAAKRRR